MHNEHGDSGGAVSNSWGDHINEAYYDVMGSDFGARTRDRINWMCSQVTGDTVLDVGCSQGISSILLAREGFRVTGIDIDKPTIVYALAERAKEVASVQDRINFQCADLFSILPGVTFDTVIMGEVIEHQTNPDRFLGKATALVGSGGRLIVTVPFGLNPWPDHKSTIFPEDLAKGISEEFTLREFSVEDGYIRLVADREVSSVTERDWAPVLKATRIGALEVQKKFYNISDDIKKLYKEKLNLQSSIKAKQDALEVEIKERSRLELQYQVGQQNLEIANSSTEGKRGRGGRRLLAQDHLELERSLAQLKATQARLDLADNELEEVKQQRAVLEVKLISMESDLERCRADLNHSKIEVGDIQLKFSNALTELESIRGELRLVPEQQKQQIAGITKKFTEEKSVLEKQLDHLRSEFSVAQAKRTGHFLHLEAERDFSRILQQRLKELHEENYRFQNSIALSIGKAVLEMRTFKGVCRFPSALLNALRAYRSRSNSIPPLKLPKRQPVILPAPSAHAASQQTGRVTNPVVVKPPTNVVANISGESARKKLSVAAWPQSIEPDKVTVMSVMDEFSRACFVPHANLIEPRPDNWEGLLDEYRPQFLFVESSWKGNFGAWQYRVGNYANPPGNEILEMVSEFKKRGIPTVFWNKEDPVHFKDFIAKATHFDHVFTTAEDALPKYSDRTTAKLGVLQFAAEEALHNPIGSADRNSKVCFAGSFYANRFIERRNDQLMLLDAARAYDFDIFDRNYKPNVPATDFSFPERFSGNIRGSLPYAEVNDAYRRYRVFLNVNSVIDSPTMFSRRVFELLACGTPVISTWSEGTEATFGNDLVWHVRNAEEANEALSILMADDREWMGRSLRGIREVFGKHTYRHRFAQVCDSIGLEQPSSERFSNILVIAEAASTLAFNLVVDSFHRQVLAPGSSKRMVVVCRGDFEMADDVVSGRDDVQIVRSELSVGTYISAMNMDVRGLAIAVISAQVVYGRFYLQDLVNALRYSGAAVVGKSRNHSLQYSYDVELDPASVLIAGGRLTTGSLARLLDGNESLMAEKRAAFAADQANFLRVSGELDRVRVIDELRKVEM